MTTTPTYTNNDLDELTEILQLLSSPRRVYVLEAMRGEDSLDRRELVTRVTKLSNPGERPSGKIRKRTNIALYQVHIDSLSNEIVWDRENDTISQGARFDETIAVLDAALRAHRQS